VTVETTAEAFLWNALSVNRRTRTGRENVTTHCGGANARDPVKDDAHELIGTRLDNQQKL
jgi:hypothetical protein